MRRNEIVLVLVFLFAPITLGAASETSSAGVTLGVTAGVTVDVAPFGIDQLFTTFQGFFFLPGIVSLGLKPSIGFNDEARMVRVPVVVNQRYRFRPGGAVFLSLFVGGGIEYYSSGPESDVSPYFTGGVSVGIGQFFLDVPVSSALRDDGSDTDFGVTAGIFFEF